MMDLKNALKSFAGRDGERAVSPVIGVILMVAITVILAAVIGTFVLGLGDRVSQASPNTQFGFDYTAAGNNADVVDITHDGGDAVESDQLEVTINGNSAWEAGTFDSGNSFKEGSSNWDGKITAGNTLSIQEDGADVIGEDDTVKVIWTASGSDKTAIIGESEVSF